MLLQKVVQIFTPEWKFDAIQFFQNVTLTAEGSFESEMHLETWLNSPGCHVQTNQDYIFCTNSYLPGNLLLCLLLLDLQESQCKVTKMKNEQSKKISVVEENINVLDFNCEKISDYQLFSHSSLKYHDWTSECFRHDSNLVYRSLQDSLEWKQRMRRRQRTSFFFITCLYEIVEFGKG